MRKGRDKFSSPIVPLGTLKPTGSRNVSDSDTRMQHSQWIHSGQYGAAPLAGALLPRVERVTYRADGTVERIEIGNLATPDAALTTMTVAEKVEIGYDANHRPVSGSLMTGTTTHALSETSYDELGRPEGTALRMDPADWGSGAADACSQDPTPSTTYGPDRITRIVRDSAGQVREQRSAVGTSLETAEVATTYLPNGQAETVKDGEGNLTTYELAEPVVTIGSPRRRWPKS